MLMQLNTVQWVSLPLETRLKLVDIFDIPRSGNTEVEDNKIITDGYTHQDLAHITIEKMQGFLLDTVTDDYFGLFQRILDVINEEAVKPELSDKQEVEIIHTPCGKKIEECICKDTQVEIINANEIKKDEQTKEGDQIKGSTPKRTRTKSGSNKKESKS